ncbi:MAG: GNAT family N-acetyltransferase [Actinobacteria bacterium]|nr:MAG: GNAT family N-acetyltransferase [Actinomycetota bacterium]
MSSKLSIEDIYTPTDNEWDLIWKDCNYATYFHSREWAQIWSVYLKGKSNPCPKLILFSDGKKALLPLSIQSGFKGLTKTHISSPEGTYGGWISEDKLEIAQGKLIVDHLYKEYPNLLWFINPYDPLISKLDIKPVVEDKTYAIDLSAGFDDAYNKWKPSKKNRVRRATKLGIICRKANSLEDWMAYYRVYKDSLSRWGNKATTNYKEELLTQLFNRHSPNIKLWLAEYENKVISGSLFLYAKNHIVSWHASSLKKYLTTGVAIFLKYNAMKDACQDGYKWFDLNPCGGHEGVREYKKEFGASELDASVVCIQTPLKKILTKTYNTLKK